MYNKVLCLVAEWQDIKGNPSDEVYFDFKVFDRVRQTDQVPGA